MTGVQTCALPIFLKKLSKETIITLINKEIVKGGFLFALKEGVFIENKQLRLLYRKPATSFNEKAVQQYQANCLSVMEEVVYEESDRIDLVIFINGLALFAIELKFNPSGQSVQDAIKQLKGRNQMQLVVFLAWTRKNWLVRR